MPKYGWKPEYNQQPPPKKKGWPPPPDMTVRKTLKKSQLTMTVVPPEPPEMTPEEVRIVYEREIYRLFSLHASPKELLNQYERQKDEKVSPGMVSAWLSHSHQGEADEDMMPDGKGSAQLARGVYYKGMFKKGLLHGAGRLEWDNGSSFEGNFYCNRLLGRGAYSWVGGASYTGQIYDGVPHGQGKIEGPRGFVYQGRWDHGRRHGLGRMIYGKEATYEGNWSNDRKHGDGKFVYATGSSYLGTWLDGKRHGKGKQIQRIIPSKEKGGKGAIASHALAVDGRPDTVHAHCYEGDWLGGLPHGSGRSEWPWDGKKKDASILTNSYVGEYKQGMRHGKGAFYYGSGALFKGNWQDNMKVGLGVLVYETGKVHFGVFSHDRYSPVPEPGFDIIEPLVSTVTYVKEEDIEVAKHGILRTIMRYKNDLQDAFLFYCSLKNDSPPEKSVVKENKVKESKSPKDQGKEDEKVLKDQGKDDEKATKNEKEGKAFKKGKKGGKEDKKGNKGKKEKDPKKEPEVEEPPYETAKEVEQEPESPRQGVAGRSRGITNQQFWRLLQDAHILRPGIGVADVDRMVPVNELSWDSVSDVHSPTRQLILREFTVALVQIALCRFHKEQISSEEKVEKLFCSAFDSLASLDYDSWFFKVECPSVRAVLSESEVMLRKLFSEMLLESETRDYTICLGSVIKYGQDRRPASDVPPGTLLARVLRELYHYQMKPDENVFDCLYHNINYTEFEIILLIFSTLGEDLKRAGSEGAMEQLALLLKGFLGGSSGKGAKPGIAEDKKKKGAKLEPKKEIRRKDNPPWVK